MTEPPLRSDGRSGRFDEVLDEAEMLLELDAARAEVWVSGLVAEWADTDDVLARLAASDRPAATAIVCALAAFVPEARPVVTARAEAGVALPSWAAHVGSAVPVLAWQIVDPFSGNVSLVVEFEHADLVRHSMLVEIEDECAVDINFGPPGLVDDAFAESDTRSLSVHEWTVERALTAIAAAMDRTAADPDVPVTDDYVMNAAVATARVGAFASAPPSTRASVPVAGDAVGPRRPPRDPGDIEADAAACATLRSALARQLAVEVPATELHDAAAEVRASLAAGAEPDLTALADDVGLGDPSLVDDAVLLERLAGAFVVPGELLAFAPVERDALRGLEWADWLGAVIPLVRGGAGADARPLQLVQNINRCPEVTTTVPKRDAPVVADVFSRGLHAWELTRAIDADGRLTALGAWLIPRALLRAWGAPHT